MTEADIIIIGSGIGALSVAGELCKNGRKVLVITKGLKKSCNSSLAQVVFPLPFLTRTITNGTTKILWQLVATSMILTQ